jgi:hypothetical protein
VEEFNPEGEKFNPTEHDAQLLVPDPSKEPNTVAFVIQTGWRIGSRILRPARVACVQAPPKPPKAKAPKKEKKVKKSEKEEKKEKGKDKEEESE